MARCVCVCVGGGGGGGGGALSVLMKALHSITHIALGFYLDLWASSCPVSLHHHAPLYQMLGLFS